MLFCLFPPSIVLLLAVASVAVPLATTSVASHDDDFSAVLGVGPGSGNNNFGRLFSVHYIYTCIANTVVSIAVLVRIFCWSGISGRKAATFDYAVLFDLCLLPMYNGKADVTAGLIFVEPGAGIFVQSRVLLFFGVGVAVRAHLTGRMSAVVAMVQGAAAMTLVPVTGLAMRSEAKSPLPLGIFFAASLMIFLTITGAKAITESPAYVAPAAQLEEEDGTDLANVDTPPPAYPRHQMESVYSA